jgi:group I intron endonuclease
MTDREKLIDLILNLTDEEAEQILLHMKEEEQEANEPFHKVVYLIKDAVTGKEYIGMTENYDRRVKYHMSRLKNGKHFVEDMQSDFNKHGDCFTVSILEEVNDRRQRKREFELIESHKSYIRGNGYNYKDRIFNNWRVAKERKNK